MEKYKKGDVVWVRATVENTRPEEDELQVSFDEDSDLGKDHYRIGIPVDQVRYDDEIVGIDVDLARYPLPAQALTASGKIITVLERMDDGQFQAFDNATGEALTYNRHGVFRNMRPSLDFPDALKLYSASRQERIVAIRKPETADTDSGQLWLPIAID